jgi:integrase
MQPQLTPSWLPSMPPAKPHRLPPFVESARAKGRVYLYFRHKGVRLARLPDDATSPEFHEAYAHWLRRIETDPKPKAHIEGTVGWVIASYRASPKFKTLNEKTRQSYEREIDRLAPITGFAASDVKRRHVNTIRDTLVDRPRTRELFGRVVSIVFNYGIRELDLEMINPARLMGRDGEAESYLPWSDAERALFEASSPPVHVMTAYMVGLYTGPRRGDIVGLKRRDDLGHALAIGGSKTKNPIAVAIHPALRTYLDTLPASLTIIADKLGRPVKDSRLSKDLRAHLDSIGLPHLHLHGLRHTAGKMLAEAGCSSHEIAAVLGHSTLQMVERYTKRADQVRLAGAAIVKLRGK